MGHVMIRFAIASAALLLCGTLSTAQSQGLRVPAGFEVLQVTDSAGESLAPDIHCMTLDPQGRVVVAGRGYIRVLLDDNGDGKADRALDFAAAPKDGAMGLFWEGRDLYCVGDGGLRVYRDAAGKGREAPSALLFPCRTGSEHLAHAVGRGPDGWLYLLVGDQTDITGKLPLLPTSPVRSRIGGCVLRIAPDLGGYEIVADGLRNAYAMDWNSDGELFTFDSDNERCVSLPWYEPTRCYHVRPGGMHGWLNRPHATTWRMPPHFVDVVPPLATLGRGSPTGVVCYRHVQFPEKYRDGLFLLDWTFGVVHFVEAKRTGSGYAGKSEVFLRSTGDDGFAPTAAAVHPETGDLYLSIGGRGTRGAVYRVRYTAGLKDASARAAEKYRPASRSLEWRAGLGDELVRRGTGADLLLRVQALEFAWRHRQRLANADLERLVDANAGHADRAIRQATARLLRDVSVKRQPSTPLERTTWYLARPDLAAVDLVADTRLPVGIRLEAVRLVQIALGDIGSPASKGGAWEGYSRRKAVAVPERVRQALRKAFPLARADDDVLDAELARTLALIEDEAAIGVAQRLTDRSDPVADIHYLLVLARLKGKRPPEEVTRRCTEALLRLDERLTALKQNRDRNWPLRIAELHTALAARDPALNAAMLSHKDFGRPDHALFMRASPALSFDRKKAAERFLGRAAQDTNYAWNADAIRLLGELPPTTALPALRKLWGEQGQDDAILSVLAKHAAEADRARFVESLGSTRLATVRTALGAMERLPVVPPAHRRDETLALLRAGRLFGGDKEELAVRKRLLDQVARLAGEKLADLPAAQAWFRKQWPADASKLDASDGVDVAGWNKRLAGIDWSKGDAGRGKSVFVKTTCAACHSGAAALGPDLHGVTKRFSREDLFTAILQPNKDVPARYRTMQLTLSSGKVYQGIIVYEAVDGVLLLTGPGESVRLKQERVSERRQLPTSLMPAGLLDRLRDAEIADLYAYLRSE